MKFLHLPVHDFEGITRDFEQLEGILSGSAHGSVTIPATGTATSTVTVTHGLPAAPTVVLASLDWLSDAAVVYPTSLGATTFQLVGALTDPMAVLSADSTAYWLAIG